MVRILGILVVLVVAILGISFAVLNAQPVAINYYLGVDEAPLALIVVLAFAAGVLLGLVGGVFKAVRLANEARRLRREIRRIEKEVISLRPITIEDAD